MPIIALETWIEQAKRKAQRGPLEEADWARLRTLAAALAADARPAAVRQRLLYLHASSPSIRSHVVGYALHEPTPDSVTEIDPTAPEQPPYATVHDAILDGWRVIHFPDQRAPFDDREIDILGYEFILEMMEVCHDASD